jgi:DNA-binding MarR family transcriptional regulator
MTQTVEQPAVHRLPAELVSSALFLLKKLGMAAKEQSFEAYEEAGLHPYHHAILAVLDEGSRETQGAIAEALDYDKGQLVGFLDELEGDGLIERKRDTVDRRRQAVTITPAGRKTLEQLRKLSQQMEDDFLTPLNASERKQLHELLLRVANEHLPNCQLTQFASNNG